MQTHDKGTGFRQGVVVAPRVAHPPTQPVSLEQGEHSPKTVEDLIADLWECCRGQRYEDLAFSAIELVNDRNLSLSANQRREAFALAAWGHYLIDELDFAKTFIELAKQCPEAVACQLYVARDEAREKSHRDPQKDFDRLGQIRKTIGSSLAHLEALVTFSHLVKKPDLLTIVRLLRDPEGNSVATIPSTPEEAGRFATVLLDAGKLIHVHLRGAQDEDLVRSLFARAVTHFTSAKDLGGQAEALLCLARDYSQRGDAIGAAKLAQQSMDASLQLLELTGEGGTQVRQMRSALKIIKTVRD